MALFDINGNIIENYYGGNDINNDLVVLFIIKDFF